MAPLQGPETPRRIPWGESPRGAGCNQEVGGEKLEDRDSEEACVGRIGFVILSDEDLFQERLKDAGHASSP